MIALRSIRIPAMLLALALAGGLILMTIDFTSHLEDGNSAPIRSDVRTLLATIVIVTSIWIALRLIKGWIDGLGRALGEVGPAELRRLGEALEVVARDRDLQNAVLLDKVAEARQHADNEVQASMRWIIQRFGLGPEPESP